MLQKENQLFREEIARSNVAQSNVDIDEFSEALAQTPEDESETFEAKRKEKPTEEEWDSLTDWEQAAERIRLANVSFRLKSFFRLTKNF